MGVNRRSSRDADPGSPNDYNPESYGGDQRQDREPDTKSKQMESSISWYHAADVDLPEDFNPPPQVESTELNEQRARQAVTEPFDFKDFGASPLTSEPAFEDTISMEKNVREYPIAESKEDEAPT